MISARRTVGGTATVSGQSIVVGFNDLGTRETRQASTGLDYYGASTAGDSGRVAILPLSQGNQFIRRAAVPVTNTLSPTAWDTYAWGAQQCAMQIEIREMQALGTNKPVFVRFHYMLGGASTFSDFQASDGTWYNQDRDIIVPAAGIAPIPFYCENLGSNVNPALANPALTIKLDRIVDFLALLGADSIDVNNSLSIWSNSGEATVTEPIIPSDPNDTGIVIRKGFDMSGFTSGFSIVTDHRVYLPEDLNQVTVGQPAQSGLPGGFNYFPPVSIFASEKRFGISAGSVSAVTLDGQLTSLQEDDGTTVNPLDLQTSVGAATAINTGTITANLSQMISPAQLPPVNKMTWLVVIEEIHEN